MRAPDPPQADGNDLDRRIEALRHHTDARQRLRLRSEIIIDALPIADRVARRYRYRCEPFDDLQQVARLGLIKAVDGFDPVRGHPFTSYAVPTIAGEVKRYFRDKGWTIRPPRRLQETLLRIRAARGALEQRLGTAASPHDIAGELGISSQEVETALRADRCYRLGALPQEAPATVREDVLSMDDPRLATVETMVTLLRLARDEPYQYRRILYLRYFLDLTQDQIGSEVGVSQMQVSRILSGALARMRDRADPELSPRATA